MVDRAKRVCEERATKLTLSSTPDERDLATPPASSVITILLDQINNGPIKTLQKYQAHQDNFRQFVSKQTEQLCEDGDLVNQEKILVFTRYWYTERRNQKQELITLKKESHKGVIAALQNLYQTQKALKVS